MDERKKSRCIVCGNEKPGIEIKVDSVVTALRWLNTHTVKHKNPFKPVVCRDCYPRYKKARTSFEHKRIAYIAIGIIFAVTIVVASRARPSSFLIGLGVIAFMYLLSLINYMPALDIDGAAGARQSVMHTIAKNR